IYLPSDLDPTGYSIVSRIHKGVESFVHDVCTVVGDDVLDLQFDNHLIQEPLRCFGTGIWRPGAWADRLAIEDHYTGRGAVTTST
ncbi:MAG: hypothetical protein ACREVT_04495, partial [Burkholderiales bacterium]